MLAQLKSALEVLHRVYTVEQVGINTERANGNLALGNPEEACSYIRAIGRDGITLLREQTHQPAGQGSRQPAAKEFPAPRKRFLVSQRKNGSVVVITSEELKAEKRLGESRLQGNPPNRRHRLH